MKKADKHNFHVSCPAAWRYNGDVNLEHGGTFFSKPDLLLMSVGQEDSIEVIRVSELSRMDDLFVIESGTVYMGESQMPTDEHMVNVFGESILEEKNNPLMWAQLQCEVVIGENGIENAGREIVQIGKRNSKDAGSNCPFKPDRVLAHNAVLANYLREEYLRTV